MPYINVKLPPTIVTINLPPMQSNGTTLSVAGSTRITEQSNTRVTRGGNTRVTRDYTITKRPELMVLKLPSTTISLTVPSGDNPFWSQTRHG